MVINGRVLLSLETDHKQSPTNLCSEGDKNIKNAYFPGAVHMSHVSVNVIIVIAVQAGFIRYAVLLCYTGFDNVQVRNTPQIIISMSSQRLWRNSFRATDETESVN